MNKTGNASPTSALALGTSTMGVFCALTGIIQAEGLLILGVWLLGGFAIHLYAGITALKQGNSLDAGIFVYYGVYLELVGGIGFMLKWAAFHFGWQIDFLLDGYMWIPLWIGLWFWSYAIFRLCPGVLGIGILFADIAFPLVSLIGLGVLSTPFDLIAGICLLGTSLCFMYLGGSSMINIVFEKDILPLGGAMIKKKV